MLIDYVLHDHNVARLLRIDEKSRDQIYLYLIAVRFKEGIWMC